jgi:hypothetical protein
MISITVEAVIVQGNRGSVPPPSIEPNGNKRG